MKKKVCLCAAIAALGLVAAQTTHGCACGCGMFDVGTTSLLPDGKGGMVFVNYAYQDQRHNWAGNGPAPSLNNDDRDLRTWYVIPGVQYFFNRSWGVSAELPIAERYFKAVGGASGNDIVGLNWWGLGDAKINVQYTGFSEYMSSGVTLGLKLPTGDYHHNDAFGDVDRDSEIGTGSTDILLGGFYRGYFPTGTGLAWFSQVSLDVPALTQERYRPGFELDAALGIYFEKLHVGSVRVSPMAQVIGAFRTADSGAEASGGIDSDPDEGVKSGYQRLLFSPGIEVNWRPIRFHADIEIPLYQQVNGNQLTASMLFKCSLSYLF